MGLARIVTNTTQYSYITPIRKTLYWLPIKHHSIFKTALLVYKVLHCGYSKYLVPFLKPRRSVYNTRKSQADCVLLEVLHFATTVFNSTKHFASDALKIWNDLSNDLRLDSSAHSKRSSKPASLKKHTIFNTLQFKKIKSRKTVKQHDCKSSMTCEIASEILKIPDLSKIRLTDVLHMP